MVNYCKALYSAVANMQLSSEGYNSVEGDRGIGAMQLCSRKRKHCEMVGIDPISTPVLPEPGLG